MLKNIKNSTIRGSDIRLDYEKGENPNEIASIIEEIDQRNRQPEKTIMNEKRQEKNPNDIIQIRGDTLIVIKDEWSVIRCPKCNNINRLPAGGDNDQISQEFQINISKHHFDLYLPYVFILITCPFCQTENKARKDSDHVICHKCSNSFSILIDNNHNNINSLNNFHFNPLHMPPNINNPFISNNPIINTMQPILPHRKNNYPNLEHSMNSIPIPIRSPLHPLPIMPNFLPINDMNIISDIFPRPIYSKQSIPDIKRIKYSPMKFNNNYNQNRDCGDDLSERLTKMDLIKDVYDKERNKKFPNFSENNYKNDKFKAIKELIRTVDKINHNTLNSANLKTSYLDKDHGKDSILQLNRECSNEYKYDKDIKKYKPRNYINPLKSHAMYMNIFSKDLNTDNYSTFKKNAEKIGRHNIEEFILPSNGSNTR